MIGEDKKDKSWAKSGILRTAIIPKEIYLR
jgi:hypothetical protein